MKCGGRRVSARRKLDHPGMSYGLFHATMQPNKLYGIVTTSVKFPGVLMDIGHLRHNRWAKSNDQAEWVAYNRMRGKYSSALEHATPERFFVDATTCNLSTATPTSVPPFDATKSACAEAVSAMKAIAVAQAQGQKVYTITSQNVATVLPQLNHSQATVEDIQNAVSAGKEVTISQTRVTQSGWTGSGYIVVDPQTGAGSYLIDGKANGGDMKTEDGKDLAWADMSGWAKDLGDWLSKVAEEFGKKLLKLLGKVAGKISDAYDLFKLLDECSGRDAFLAFSFYAFWQITSIVALAFAAGGGILIFLVVALLVVLITSALTDAISKRCRQ